MKFLVQKGRCPPLCLFVEIPDGLILSGLDQSGASASSTVFVLDAVGGFTLISDPSFVAGADNFQFSHENGVLTYTGLVPRRFGVYGQISGNATDPDISVSLAVFHNGAPINANRAAGFETFDNLDTHQVNTSEWVLLNPGDTVQLAYIAIGGNLNLVNGTILVQ